MRNHDEKKKDMQRSVLPSSARKAAREVRRRIHKAARSRQRDALAQFDPGAAGNFDPDFREGRRRSRTKWMVYDRRSADKVGPLTRWAVATVNAKPELRDAAIHEQVAHFAAMLPTDLIGAHAVQHIEWALRYHGWTWPDPRPIAAERRQRHRDQVAADVRRLLEAGAHGALNDALREAYGRVVAEDSTDVVGCLGRFVAGLHDIDAFADEVAWSEEVRRVIADLAARFV